MAQRMEMIAVIPGPALLPLPERGRVGEGGAAA
jgi:hypothetical protein